MSERFIFRLTRTSNPLIGIIGLSLITRSAPNGCRTGNFGSPAWSAMNRSSEPRRLGHRRCGFQFGGQRTSGHGTRGARRGTASPRTLVVGGTDGRIKSNAGFGGRCVGAPDARGESVPSNDGTAAPLSLSGRARNGALGGTGGDRQQSAGDGPSPEAQDTEEGMRARRRGTKRMAKTQENHRGVR